MQWCTTLNSSRPANLHTLLRPRLWIVLVQLSVLFLSLTFVLLIILICKSPIDLSIMQLLPRGAVFSWIMPVSSCSFFISSNYLSYFFHKKLKTRVFHCSSPWSVPGQDCTSMNIPGICIPFYSNGCNHSSSHHSLLLTCWQYQNEAIRQKNAHFIVVCCL